MRADTRSVLVVHPGAELFGSDRMLLESVQGLIEHDYRVIVALPSRGPLIPLLTDMGARIEIIPMFVLRKKLLAPQRWPLLLFSAVRGAIAGWRMLGRWRPAAVYVSTIIIPQWPLLARLRGIRSVSHVHEAERSGNRWMNRALYLPHLASQRILVNSRFSQETIRWALPALANRSEVVYNGVAAPSRPAPPREPLEGPLRLLYMGRLSPRKGVDLVLEAAELLRNRRRQVKVTLLGTPFEGYEWYQDQLQEQAADGDLEVDFAGFHHEVWPFLAEADVLLVPSRADESFGNTAVEGILAQRPVIASNSSGLREAAGDYLTTRLVPPDDAPAIANALAEISDLWPFIVEDLPTSRERALRRHSPHVYRDAVARACTPSTRHSTPTERTS